MNRFFDLIWFNSIWCTDRLHTDIWILWQELLFDWRMPFGILCCVMLQTVFSLLVAFISSFHEFQRVSDVTGRTGKLSTAYK